MVPVTKAAKRLVLAWMLIVSLAAGPAIVVGMAAAQAAIGCGAGQTDCPCDKASCGSVTSCLSHCLQIAGQTTLAALPAEPLRGAPEAAPDAALRSVGQRPGLDPPQA